MALATAEIIRGRLNDRWRVDSEVQYGDGTASSWKLRQGAPYSNVISATASIIVAAGWSATGATVDTALGLVTVGTAVSANSAVRFDYQWAVFSEDDVAYFTAQGSIPKATREGIRWLMGDAWKRARWAAPDGSTYDDTKALDNLRRLYDTLVEEEFDQQGPDGGLESWSVNQGVY
jgi:hypothetical protein